MLGLILRRLLMVIPTLLIVTFGVFLLVKLVPTDPAVAAAGGENATFQAIAQKREEAERAFHRVGTVQAGTLRKARETAAKPAWTVDRYPRAGLPSICGGGEHRAGASIAGNGKRPGTEGGARDDGTGGTRHPGAHRTHRPPRVIQRLARLRARAASRSHATASSAVMFPSSAFIRRQSSKR